jgi:hypothetical protein
MATDVHRVLSDHSLYTSFTDSALRFNVINKQVSSTAAAASGTDTRGRTLIERIHEFDAYGNTGSTQQDASTSTTAAAHNFRYT